MNKRKTVNWVKGLSKGAEQETGNLNIDACNVLVQVLIPDTNVRFWLHANHQLTTRLIVKGDHWILMIRIYLDRPSIWVANWA